MLFFAIQCPSDKPKLQLPVDIAESSVTKNEDKKVTFAKCW